MFFFLTTLAIAPPPGFRDGLEVLSTVGVILGFLLSVYLLMGVINHDINWLAAYFPAREAEVHIGYKKAVLATGWGHHFYGVSGARQGYSADDVAVKDSPGFHAYSTMAAALEHNQQGDVLLEVALSGKIVRKQKGFVAERQRVLQIIPFSCSLCPSRPETFTMVGDAPRFFCSVHEGYGRTLLRQTFEPKPSFTVNLKRTLFPGSYASAAPQVHPAYTGVPQLLDQLPEVFSWMKAHNIIVAELDGPRKFVPTVLKKEAK